MAIERCPTCHEFMILPGHRCAPRFVVWCPEMDESENDGIAIFALGADLAAEKWADHYDWTSADYDIVGQRMEPIVHVRHSDGRLFRYKVSGEATPSYYAKLITDPEA